MSENPYEAPREGAGGIAGSRRRAPRWVWWPAVLAGCAIAFHGGVCLILWLEGISETGDTRFLGWVGTSELLVSALIATWAVAKRP